MSILKPATPVDPDDQLVQCEAPGCENHLRRGDAYRFHVSMAATGKQHIAAFQCHREHYGCSLGHAALVAKACIDEHLSEMHTQADVAYADRKRREAEENAAAEARLKEAALAKAAQAAAAARRKTPAAPASETPPKRPARARKAGKANGDT